MKKSIWTEEKVLEQMIDSRKEQKDAVREWHRTLDKEEGEIHFFLLGTAIGLLSNIFVATTGIYRENAGISVISGVTILLLMLYLGYLLWQRRKGKNFAWQVMDQMNKEEMPTFHDSETYANMKKISKWYSKELRKKDKKVGR